SFVNRGGSLPSNMVDEIGKIKQTLGGILSLNIVIVSPKRAIDGPGVDTAAGVLEIHCSTSVGLAGEPEGIRFTLGAPPFEFLFQQSTGTTLFHALDDD